MGSIAVVPRNPESIRAAAKQLAGRTRREFEERVPWLSHAGLAQVQTILEGEYQAAIAASGAFCLHCGCGAVDFVQRTTGTGVWVDGSGETVLDAGYRCGHCGAFEDGVGGPPTLEQLLDWSLRLVRKEAA